MKTFKKPSLPESISHNGSEFTLNTSISSAMHLNNTPISRIAQTLRSEGRKAVVVEVLSRSLKGKTDLHGNPYKPTKWIFTEVEQEMEYKYKWSNAPEKEVYTYQCVGECKEKSTFTPKIKK